jgi:hypothetical protein
MQLKGLCCITDPFAQKLQKKHSRTAWFPHKNKDDHDGPQTDDQFPKNQPESPVPKEVHFPHT